MAAVRSLGGETALRDAEDHGRAVAEPAAMADAGTPAEPKLFALAQTLRPRRPELFAAP